MGRLQVKDIMTTDVVSVHQDTGYQEITSLLIGRGISAMPVVGEGNRVLGVVSEADLMAKVELTTAWPPAAELTQRRRRAQAKAAGDVARDLMSTPAVTIEAQASLAAAARRMADEHVTCLPVVDADDTLVGIVSRRDLLRIHLRTDDDIRKAVADEVLWQWFQVRAPQVVVEVRDGIVTLSGELERKRQVPLAVHLTHAVDGVVDVVDRLAHRIDDTHPTRR